MKKSVSVFCSFVILITLIFPSGAEAAGERVSNGRNQGVIDLSETASDPLAIASMLALPIVEVSEYSQHFKTDTVDFYYSSENYFLFSNTGRDDISIWGVCIGRPVEEAVRNVREYGSVYIIDERDYSKKCIGLLTESGTLWELYLNYDYSGEITSWAYCTDNYGSPGLVPYNEVREILELENITDRSTLKDWQSAYFEVIKYNVEEVHNPFIYDVNMPYYYTLAYLDGDEVPELLEYMPSLKNESTGVTNYPIREYSRIYSYADGELTSVQVEGACSYEERTGKLLVTSYTENTGIFSVRYDTAYQYSAGILTELGLGFYEDHMGRLIYTVWDDVELIGAGNYPSLYDRYLAKAYECLGASRLFGPNDDSTMLTAVDMCRGLTGYQEQDDEPGSSETVRLQELSAVTVAGEIVTLSSCSDIYGNVYTDAFAGGISEYDNAAEFSLGGGFHRFKGLIIRDKNAYLPGLANPNRNDIVLSVYGDGTLLYHSVSSNLIGGEWQEFDISVEGVQKLRLVINGKNYIRLCNAVLTRTETSIIPETVPAGTLSQQDIPAAPAAVGLNSLQGNILAGSIRIVDQCSDVYGNTYYGALAGEVSEFDNTIEYTLNRQYRTLTGIVIRDRGAYLPGLANPDRTDIVLSIYGDGILLYRSISSNLSGGEYQEMSVDISGVQTLRLVINGKNYIRFCNVTLTK